MRRFLISALVVGIVVAAYACGAGRGTVPDVALTASGWTAVVALAVGAGLGAAYARAKRSRDDWLGARDAMRGLRRSTYALTWVAVKWAALVAVLAAVALSAARQA